MKLETEEFAVGNKFGRLTVIGKDTVKVGAIQQNFVVIRVTCQCGSPEKTVHKSALRKGTTRSCGCLNKELSGARERTHGESRTPLYRKWFAMFERCRGYKTKDRKSYTDRGITVCERWKSYPAFKTDMGEPPTRKHQLDRIDNSKGYSPENCRWVTHRQNNNNKRNNFYITYDGRTQSAPMWAVETGLTSRLIKRRVLAGWDLKVAMTKPSSRKGAK